MADNQVLLKFPPGFARPGTRYDARERWYDGQLVRWYENAMQPVPGWLELTLTDGTQVDVGAPARGILAWRDQSGVAHLIVGTASKLYHYEGGALTEITPVTFTAGNVDSQYSGGSGTYGSGLYGAGLYGAGDPGHQSLVETTTWQVDNYGEDVVAVCLSDGQLLYWDKSAGGVASALSNAPTDCTGVVVTPERFIVALGANGDGRKIAWPDGANITTWTATSTNRANEEYLPGNGKIMACCRTRNETLIWTDEDIFALRWIGGAYTYQLVNLGKGGLISRNAAVVTGATAYWMGQHEFYRYNGIVETVPCEVADYVFNDINRTQAAKITAYARSEFGEVTWHYPSASSTENDRYVTMTEQNGKIFWTFGSMPRTAGVDRQIFGYPIAVDAAGLLWKHEQSGGAYTGVDSPWAESGPLELRSGNAVAYLNGLVPDEATLGDVEAKLYLFTWPTDTDLTEVGPFTPSGRTDFRYAAAMVMLRIDHVNDGWRWGTPKILVKPGGGR